MRARLTIAILALLMALASPSSAAASYDPLGGGVTKLTFAKSFLSLLRHDGVKMRGVNGAAVRGSAAIFPVSGGKFDPQTASGSVSHAGSLRLEAKGRGIPLKALILKTTRPHAPLSAKLGGGQLQLASAAGLAVVRRGFGVQVKTRNLRLSAKVAERLDKKLRLPGAFKGGQRVGSSLTEAQPLTVAIQETGRATLTLSPEIVAKLESLFVAVNPIFPAEHLGPTFTLPISGGQVAPGASSGVLETIGSLELLQLGGGQVFWHEAWVELGEVTLSAELDAEPSPPYGGKAGRTPLAGPSSAGFETASDARALTVTVSNLTVILTESIAQMLNEIFAEPQGRASVFKTGEPFGTISFTAQGE